MLRPAAGRAFARADPLPQAAVGPHSTARLSAMGVITRLFFGNALGVEACRGLLRQARATAEEQLETFRALRDELAADDSTREHHPYWLLTISAGEHTARAALAWAEESLTALAVLDSGAETDTRPPGT